MLAKGSKKKRAGQPTAIEEIKWVILRQLFLASFKD